VTHDKTKFTKINNIKIIKYLKIQFQSINIIVFIKNLYLYSLLSKCKLYLFMSSIVMSDGAPVKRSFPSNVFGKAITSRMLFVLHTIDSNLSIPVKSNLYKIRSQNDENLFIENCSYLKLCHHVEDNQTLTLRLDET